MKKRHILFLITAILVTAAIIIPSFVTRVVSEQNHRGYVTALEINNTRKLYKSDRDFAKILLSYKESGVTAAVVRESRHKTDTKLLDIVREAELDICLAVYGGAKKPYGYYDNLESIIDKYNVKYIMPKMAKGTSEYPLNLDKLIEKYNLIFVFSENSNQLSNEMPKGVTANMESADGRIMRSYETYRKPSITVTGNSDSSDLLYYQMINSARDRNTEFMFVNQITDQGKTPEESAKLTQNAIVRFTKWMDSHGYVQNSMPDLSGYYRSNLNASAAAGLLGVLMALAMINIVFKISNPILDMAMYVLSIAVFLITYILPSSLTVWYSTAFALVSSCFSFTICIWAADRVKGKAYIPKVFAISLITLMVCAAVLCTVLSGTDYYLNYSMFRGVKLTLLLPVAYSALAMAIYSVDLKSINPGKIANDITVRAKHIRIHHILIILVLLLAAAVYVLRSGNAKISSAENDIRNHIAEISGARPRTKEFLIGWPALALFAYYAKRNKIVRWVFAVGSSILFASVINTFCHVFTDVSTSALRTVNGLVFALPFIAVALGANKLILKMIKRTK